MIRFGVAGFGLHGRKRLLPAFARTNQAKLVAISRRDLTSAQETAQEIGVPHAFSSVEELCASPEVDVVFVASPNSFHLAHVIAAINAGKAVLCEKPMAMNAAEARAMVNAARQRGVLLGVAQIFRFHPTVVAIKELVAGGRIGTPVLACANFSFPGQDHARTWLRNAAAGGGIFADVGVHCVDSLRFVLGDEVEAVRADMLRGAEGADETATASLRFRSSTLASVDVSMRAQYYTHMEIAGEEARIVAPYAFEVAQERTIELHRGETRERIATCDNRNSYAAMIEAFARSVAEGVPFACPGEEGLHNQAVLDAAYRSAETGHATAVHD